MLENYQNSKSNTSIDLNPLVSVAVVTYNQISFLRECLESILSQDYKNFEIVVADDGSTDGTVEMLKEYASSGRACFILKLSEKNQGITKNHNLAYFACTGKYISWMAGDDLMLPGKLSCQVDFMEHNPSYSICYHDLEIFESSSGQTIKKYSDVDKPRTGGVATLIKYGSFNGAISNMVRRESAPSYGFDERVPIASDWLYWIECLWSGGKIGYLKKVLGRYRRHNNNVTSSSIKNPSIKEVQDHLFSCEIVLSRAPHLYREVNYRKAFLLLSLRWMNDGRFYNDYLWASLSVKFKIKVALGLIANTLFGYRR